MNLSIKSERSEKSLKKSKLRSIKKSGSRISWKDDQRPANGASPMSSAKNKRGRSASSGRSKSKSKSKKKSISDFNEYQHDFN